MTAFERRLPAARALLAIAAAFLVGGSLIAQRESASTHPRDLVLVYRVPGGGSLDFSVSGAPGLMNLTSVRVMRGGRLETAFQARRTYDRDSRTLNVSLAALMRPEAGEYTVELAAGRGTAIHSFPLTVRVLTGPDAPELKANPRGTRDSVPTERERPPIRTDQPMVRPERPPVRTPPPDEADEREQPPIRTDRPTEAGDRRRPVRADRPTESSGVKGPRGTATVSAFLPASPAPAGGTLVLEGTGMTSLRFVYIGETRLEKLYNDPTIVACAFPDVRVALTGDLAIDDATPGGPERIVLAPGYKVLPRNELPVAAELVRVGSASIGSDIPENQPYSHRTYGIRFRNVPGQDLPTALRVQDMTVRYPNYFGSAHNKKGDATKFFGSEYTVSFHGKSFRPLTVMEISSIGGVTARVQMPAPDAMQDYELSNTADLDESLQWKVVDSFGVTEGKSEMPLGRSVDVGKLNLDGDSAFRIASGPLGTSVTWQSAPLSMNEGWFVKEVRWSVTQTKPPGHTAKAYVKDHSKPAFNWIPSLGLFELAGYPDQFLHADTNKVWPVAGTEEPNGKLMMRFDESLKAIDGRIIADYGKNPFRWYFRPMQIRLVADMTLVNDHDVTIRMDKVVFRGPIGKRWQDAIKEPVPNEEISFMVNEDRKGGTLNVFQPRD